ncbi:HK97 family phage prohead protease [Desulfosporosinus nitroreducens]|nr:HK97 family phage prohead protease [Desulfosporosinus nitroreducens]
MRIEIRNDSVLLDGYVNAVGRDSKPIITPRGKCVEQIEPRAFQRALDRTENVDLLLNHDKTRKLGSIKDGNIELFEDNIGLRAIATVTDPDVIEKARQKKLRGWSFGQYVNKDRMEERADQLPRRHVEDLDLFEVSIIDDRMSPIYTGTSIEHRAEQEVIAEQRGDEFRAITVEIEQPKAKDEPIDYSGYEKRISDLKCC